jgi:hypothetical protein
MDGNLLLANFLNPPVLFFFLGMLAVGLKSDLEIPQPLPKLFSLYLLLSIGFKGGVELARSGVEPQVVLTLAAAVAMACLVPVYSYFILRLKLDGYNAAAIAATYGSISAVTFITAKSLLTQLEIPTDGFMVAALGLMESPAIVIGLVLVKFANPAPENPSPEAKPKSTFNWGEVLPEAFLNSSVFLIIGSLVIGALTGERGMYALKPFTEDMFYGVLSFFLLDMGIVAARRLKDLQQTGWFLIAFALLSPIVNASLGIGIARLLDLPPGDALLFMVLCASASYIAVPAAMRLAVPEANPSLYIATALGLTFPFNLLVGIPLYLYGINLLWN